MVTIIHGEDTTKSREYYLQERAKYPEKVILDESNLTLTDFLQATSNNGLFGDQQVIFIEDLLSKRKASSELDAIITQIILITQTPLFLYEPKELTPKQLQQFNNSNNVTIKHFLIPKTVFTFLDALLPGNGKKAIMLFHQLLENEDVNFALFMLQRQIRILLSFQETSTSTISEVSRLAPWQKGKLEKQAKAFAQNALLRLYEHLFQLELGQKTGTLSQPLDQAIDFLLLAI